VQDGRIHIEKINGPFLFKEGGTPAEYKAGLELAIARGWFWRHESGTYVKFTQAGADLLPEKAKRPPRYYTAPTTNSTIKIVNPITRIITSPVTRRFADSVMAETLHGAVV
jgi:hypothetical protein